MRLISLVAFIVMLLVGCAALPSGAVSSPQVSLGLGGPQASAIASSELVDTFTPPPVISSSADTACESILDDIPMVKMESGKATIAAAREVTSDQLAAYLEMQSEANGLGNQPSSWRSDPTKVVDECLFDGDFFTETPGPPGHDTSAVRVLVVVMDGQAQLVAVARKDRLALPTTDPAAL